MVNGSIVIEWRSIGPDTSKGKVDLKQISITILTKWFRKVRQFFKYEKTFPMIKRSRLLNWATYKRASLARSEYRSRVTLNNEKNRKEAKVKVTEYFCVIFTKKIGFELELRSPSTFAWSLLKKIGFELELGSLSTFFPEKNTPLPLIKF